MRSPPPEATIDYVAGDIPSEGAHKLKEESAPLAVDEGLPNVFVVAPALEDQVETKEDSSCGDDKEKM
ncbi:UNVERIFIED_CONTAM: hypothetical protein Sradi_2079600 [Sesamum radiatum]|uniref:Uncharacterized protein n=1 Tax=Sesamum radiatum TaxID=300843 RepID=A0AAW2TJQ9_SESRA